MSERDVRQLLNLIAQRIGLSYEDVVEWLRGLDANALPTIEERILRGQGALVGIDQAAGRLAADIHAQYVRAGQAASDWLDLKLPDKLVRFDVDAPSIVARARANKLELVQGFELEQSQITRQITHRALVESAEHGINPRRVAQDFRDSLGLTPQQEQWVANYRRALERGEYMRATGYELSSGQADRTLRRMARDGGTLTPRQIDDYVERYRKNAVAYRAETIARTEALANAHAGLDDAMQQAVARGDLEKGQLENEWHARRAGPRARDQHQAMNGVRVPFGTDFVLPDRTKMSGPGDPNGGAEHNANCGCARSTSFAIIPPGFDAQGKRVREGLPARSDLEDGVLYALKPGEIRSKLIALPGGGEDAARMQSIEDAWAQGKKLPPVKLLITEDGKLYVNDGRHRLLNALAQKRPVLAQIERAAAGIERGTVPLVD